MLRKLILAALLLTATFSARAVDYTDVYWDVLETGWGAFLVQSDTFQFIAFYIYGADGKPTWYTAQLTNDGTGNYTGTLYATTGTYFADPWQGDNINPAGTATFQPIDDYHATLSYTVTGVGTVMKTVQRQTLTPYVLSGNYSGSLSGSVTGCPNPANNVPLAYRFNVTVSQVADQLATLSFTIVDASNAVCTISGALTHFGRLYQIANAAYQCPLSTATQATVDHLGAIDHGIEGRWTANDGQGCKESIHFAAVLP